jgi:DNA/RNA-binding domain of Phe-tRNA-synthetase-like protein
MAKLRVSQEIFRIFPDVLIGLVPFQKINNTGQHEDVLKALREEEARTVERFSSSPIPDHPHIAPWREAYRKFGAKPKDYPSSIENLLRRVMKGHHLPHINAVVDIYNIVSLRHIVPVGGEDLDRIQGDVELTIATDHEAPVRLLGEPEERSPKPGEIIYKDDAGAICRRWNWKEADRTKFTESTANGFLVIEALPPVDRTKLDRVLDELVTLVQSHCGGSIKKGIVDPANAEISLTVSQA